MTKFPPPGPAAQTHPLLWVSAAGAPATYIDGEVYGIPNN